MGCVWRCTITCGAHNVCAGEQVHASVSPRPPTTASPTIHAYDLLPFPSAISLSSLRESKLDTLLWYREGLIHDKYLYVILGQFVMPVYFSYRLAMFLLVLECRRHWPRSSLQYPCYPRLNSQSKFILLNYRYAMAVERVFRLCV